MEAVGHLIEPAVAASKCTCNWLKRKYSYVKHIRRNFEKLEEEDGRLRDQAEDVQNELQNNESRKAITAECRTWLTRVEKMRTEIERLRCEYANKPHTCLCGLCPHRALLKLGKRVVNKTAEATLLSNERSRITIMRDKPPTVRRTHRWNNDVRIVDLQSHKHYEEMLINWLKEEGSKRISIKGPPGIGKTTIMKFVHDNIRESGRFDYTFHVTLADESRILSDIEEVIWNRLGMRMDENDPPGLRAHVISETLKKKKYVLFLDEVFSVVNLEEVGIKRNHEHGKVVFACRDKYDGDTDEDMIVQTLSNEDARKLFWEFAGADLENKREIKGIAEKIIDWCGGMPPILRLIGKQLKEKKNIELWRDMKSQLQSPSKQLWQEAEEYYRSLKVVCNELTDDKHCLLYWAIFPFGEEINRDYIIDCWIAEQFLKGQRLCQARGRGHAILHNFTDKSLLEEGEKLGHFKMFEWFQRAAFRIANQEQNPNFFVANGEKIGSHEWIGAKRVSLANNRLSPLPKRPSCAGMLTLLLHENNLGEFPRQFFESMTGLHVLCLKDKKISGLPSSISGLKNLKGLFLDNCSSLVVLPQQMGVLQNLEILVVRHTGIYSLPSEIGRLVNLKCLRVSFKEVASHDHVTVGNNLTVNSGNHHPNGEEKRIIPRKIIEKLSKLEELSVEVSPNSRRWNTNADEIAKEITMLKELTHLHFHFPQMESLDHFIWNSESWKANGENREFEGFRSFNISVGQQGNSSASDFNVFECLAEKHLKFSAGDGFPGAVSEVLKQATSFELIGYRTAGNLTDGLPDDPLEKLEVCIVEECDALTSIVNGNTNTTGVVFPCLEKLHIKKLPNLVSIWNGTIASESFCALTTLTLKECQGVRILFSLEVVTKLCKLQNLQVEDCARIEKIIEADNTVESTAFCSLKNFQLCSLTSLSSICDASLEWPDLERILIKTCEGLKTLPSVLEKAPKLREIKCAEDWLHQQEWPNIETEEQFKTFRRHFS